MQFRTQIPILKSIYPINYESKIVSIGSCFAENISKKLDYFKFQNKVNPFGIIFNAVAIERLFERIANDECFTEKDVFLHNNLWHCFEVHSQLSDMNKNILLKNLNVILKDTKNFLETSSHIILTFGTSWIYRNLATEKLVANCHKLPQNFFIKELLTAEQTIVSIQNILDFATKINAKVSFIFTISPVRHIKDGFVENNVSKAVLLQSIFQVIKASNSKHIEYFPSFEIIIDELRDYRFFEADMLHPNQVAVDYVWKQFFLNHMPETIFSTMQEVCDIQKMLQHRPSNHNSEENKKFQSKIQQKIEKLQTARPEIFF